MNAYEIRRCIEALELEKSRLERENARLRDVAVSLIAWIEAPTDDQSHTLKALQRKAEAALANPTNARQTDARG